jgi:hypothetical protein
MYREIIISAGKKQTIELPDDFIGKKVEIIAFPIEETKNHLDRTEIAFKFWRTHSIDMSDFKFDRDEANER